MDPTSSIQFHFEDIAMPKDMEQDRYAKWVERIIDNEGFELAAINYIFCSDDYLLNINRQYLDHDYYTDIITFDNADEGGALEADIFISVERVADNAQKLGIDFSKELQRVMAHGILHLCGYKDKSEEDIKVMRLKEEASMALYQ